MKPFTRKDRAGYWIRYKDDRKRWVTRKGGATYEHACAALDRAEKKATAIREGWVDRRHVEASEAMRRPIGEVVREYREHLEGMRRSAAYIKELVRTVRAVIDRTSVKCLGDINVRDVERFLADLGKRGRSARTRNQYLNGMVALVNWCVKRGMMIENPLRVVDKLNERADRREVSRALIPEEFERLLRATPDEDRRLYYLMAGRTGLRWSEIRRLRWQDLDLQAGWIFLDAASTKAKRDDTLPIAPDLLALLGERKKSMGPIFSSSPTRPTFKRDVARAGLQYDNARGQVDRKSLRKTFGTHLALAGVDFRLAVKLMRHTDPKLTQNIYTDPLLLDMQGAVKKLVPRTIQKAVGESHG